VKNNEAIDSFSRFKTSVEQATDYIENFDILETINNVGNDEVFTPLKICNQMLDILPNDVWLNPNFKWLNPVDKNGVFLREIAIRLDKGLAEWEPSTLKRRKHIFKNMLFSIGLTRFTAQVSRRTVYYCSKANKSFDGKLDENQSPVNGYAIGNGSWFSNEEGNIITPDAEHSFVKGKCQFCGISQNSKYTDSNQVEHYAYQFIHQENINNYFGYKFLKENREMKFDVIVGNPPYQLKVNDGGKGLGAVPIYQKFVSLAMALNPKYLTMIIPSRWFSGGVGLDDFRSEMLNDKRISTIVDYNDSRECFPNYDINGGVCYFLWNRDEINERCKYTYVSNGVSYTSLRKMNEFEIFVRNTKALKIIEKVIGKKEQSISEIVSAQTPFGLNSNFRGKEKPFLDSLMYFSSDGVSYVSKNDVTKGKDLIKDFKVMLPKITSEHAGIPDKNGKYKVLTPLKILKANEICSQSYLIVGPVTTLNEANNLKAYLETKFARFLLLISIPGMNISKDKFRFIPLQDFTSSISDKELYKKYKLDWEDINTIETLIKEISN
jgi:site-specific DNA-methyltransferase (adenine-specific)